MDLKTLSSKSHHEDESIEIQYLPGGSSWKRNCIILATILFLVSLAFITQACLKPDQAQISWLPATICVLLFSLFSLILLLVSNQKKTIIFSKDCLDFPAEFNPDLLYRPNRKWDDIANILLGSMLLDRSKSTYEHELESAQDSKKVFIYFKSGGHANINLNRLDKRGSEKLFLAIESWCLEYSRVPREKEKEEKPEDNWKLPRSSQARLPESYTELWEQEYQDNFSRTNFLPLKKGDLVASNKYRVLMPLSSGGLSAVYLVESKDGVFRILKESVIPENYKLKEKARELFQREAYLLQKIDHPGIASVYDYFVENGRDYLLLEFIKGSTLRQVLAHNGPFLEEKALKYALFVTEIVGYLHKLDPPVIHRDITPTNLVLKEDDTIVLIDFGAANELLNTVTGTLIGKQAYMAPEQFRGKASTRSDIYGIGATLFFLLTGSDPRPLEELSPRSLNKLVSPSTDSLVSLCTRQKEEERIQSTDELETKLLDILEHGGGAIIDTSKTG